MKTSEIPSQIDPAIRELIQILSSFTEKELNTVPVEGSWTAAQIGEHLLKSYGVETLNGEVKTTQRVPDEKVEMLKSIFLNFDIKMNSPQFIIPSTASIDKETLLNSLEIRRAEISEVIKNKDLSATCTSFVVPEFGELTRLEWLALMLFHTQRHIRQLKVIIDNIK